MTRRQFLNQTSAAVVAASALGTLPGVRAQSVSFKRKIKLGLIGCGGRESWIAHHFQAHGGYDLIAVADYFPEVANSCGDALGVDRTRRFASLSGYKQLLESGVEAVALETPPCFFHTHAAAAVAPGIHVYMAKPIAVDVPGALSIEKAAGIATVKQLSFLVDYQMRTDPADQEVLQRIQSPGFGRIAQIQTYGLCSGFPDPAKSSTIESRLQHLIWVNDIAIGCDYIGNYDIHAIDAALWVLGERPTAAMGSSSVRRHQPHGDSHDVCSVIYQYESGVVHNHLAKRFATRFTTNSVAGLMAAMAPLS